MGQQEEKKTEEPVGGSPKKDGKARIVKKPSRFSFCLKLLQVFVLGLYLLKFAVDDIGIPVLLHKALIGPLVDLPFPVCGGNLLFSLQDFVDFKPDALDVRILLRGIFAFKLCEKIAVYRVVDIGDASVDAVAFENNQEGGEQEHPFFRAKLLNFAKRIGGGEYGAAPPSADSSDAGKDARPLTWDLLTHPV